jgi:hypothetical protein
LRSGHAKGWHIDLDGSIVLADTRFELVFERGSAPAAGSAAGSTLVAVLRPDEPRPLRLQDLAAALGHQTDIAVEIDVMPAAVALAGDELKLFALDVGAGVDLADLPLVGPRVDDHGGLGFVLQLTYASRELAAADQTVVSAINRLLPAGATPLPDAVKIKAELALRTMLEAGGETIAIDLSLAADAQGKPTPSGSPAPRPALTG